MTRAIYDEPEYWVNVKLVLTHFEHLKTFTKIQSHLKIEREHLKMSGTSSVALAAKGNRPRGNKGNEVGRLRKVLPLPSSKRWDKS